MNKLKLSDGMSLKDFKKYCEENDSNVVKKWDYTKFRMFCEKCESTNVVMVCDMSYGSESGCPTCGSWLEAEGAIVIKCENCGQGMTVMEADENKYR